MTDEHFKRRPERDRLPILGLNLGEKEELLAYKAKRRPGIVVACNASKVLPADISVRSLPAHHTDLRVVVAPLYGIATESDPKGFSPKLWQRIRHLLYRQFFPCPRWSEKRPSRMFPAATSLEEGVARFDRLQFAVPTTAGCQLVPLKLAAGPFEVLQSCLWEYFHAHGLGSRSVQELRDLLAEEWRP